MENSIFYIYSMYEFSHSQGHSVPMVALNNYFDVRCFPRATVSERRVQMSRSAICCHMQCSRKYRYSITSSRSRPRCDANRLQSTFYAREDFVIANDRIPLLLLGLDGR